MVSTRKIKVPAFLDEDLVQRIENIVKDDDTVFEDRGQVIRYCLRVQLPLIEKQIKEDRQR